MSVSNSETEPVSATGTSKKEEKYDEDEPCDIPRERWPHVLEEVEKIVQKVSSVDLETPQFMPSPVLACCDEKLADNFLSERVRMEVFSDAESRRVQLYSGCFWGLVDTVKPLLEQGTSPNQQNKSTRWTPLHAAVFMEHEEITLLLLKNGADPTIQDSGGRTPKDFGSASEKIWPHFEALGCTRTPVDELIKMGIICKPQSPSPPPSPTPFNLLASALGMEGLIKHCKTRSSFSGTTPHQPGSSYTLQQPEQHERDRVEDEEEGREMDDPRAMAAALSGDVLAGEDVEGGESWRSTSRLNIWSS